MPRKFENWLLAFRNWTVPRTEAPENFLIWTGLFTIAVSVRKHVRISKKHLAGWEAYPNIFVIFVGPPASRKTTAMNFADDLLCKIPEIQAAPTRATESALGTALATSKDGSTYITASELASFISKSKLDMYEFLTDGYDTRKDIKILTQIRSLETVTNPCINMLACTQPIWLSENMPASVIGGGFASRCLIIQEDVASNWKLFRRDIDMKHYDNMEKDLISDLLHIANLRGDFEIEDTSLENEMDAWYIEGMEIIHTRDSKLQGYYGRRHVHLLKTCMLLSLAQKDELVITRENFIQAKMILEMAEKKLINVFKGIGKNIFTVEMDDIRNFISVRKKVERQLVLKNFQASALPDVLNKLIDGLIMMGDVETTVENKTAYLQLSQSNPKEKLNQ